MTFALIYFEKYRLLVNKVKSLSFRQYGLFLYVYILFLSLREVYKFSILEIPSSEQSLGVLFTQEYLSY